MIHALMPWNRLTRTGIPPLKVARRDLVLGEVIVPVGETLDPELFPMQIRALRLRQFYEQRRLEPVDPGLSSQQYYHEAFERMHPQQGAADTLAEIFRPVTPVASHIVAGDLPTIDVPIEADEPRPKGKTKGVR